MLQSITGFTAAARDGMIFAREATQGYPTVEQGLSPWSLGGALS
jgi:hypothetical protein